MRQWVAVLLMLLLTSAAAAAPLAPPRHTEVAPGIHLFQTAPYGDVGLDGNAVVIVGSDGVLVFDANGTPAAARAVITELRRLTPLPVRTLVLSHWHWDHWYGAEEYARAFPGLSIVAHEKARALMAGPAIAFNQPGLDSQLPGHIAEVEAELAKARAAHRADAAELAEHVERDRFFLAQKRGMKPTLPTLTFTDSLTLHMGGREVRILHVDRAITPGDAFLYLPQENVLVSGDLLINPVTFALFCYPDGWIRTLEWLDALDAAVIVPGHGAPLRDENLLHDTLALLRRERALVRDAVAAGRNVADTRTAVIADAEVLRLRERITGGDARRNDAFALYLVDWFVQRAHAEARGPLDDSIPALE